MKIRLVSAVVASVALLSSASFAGVQVFSSESAFLAAAPAVSTETFESYPTDQEWTSLSVTFDGVNYQTTTNFPGNTTWAIRDAFNPHSAPNGLVSNTALDQQITFGNGGYVQAFGMWLSVPQASFQIYDLITVIERNGQETTLHFTPQSASASYLGFISNAGIKQINVCDWPGDGSNWANWVFDDVSHSSVVPEPSSILALVCGVGGMGGMIWRRRSV